MQTATFLLDDAHRRAHEAKNTLHTALLVGGLGLLTAFCAWLLWGMSGVVAAALAVGGIYLLAPRVPGELVMRMFRARRLDPRHGAQITRVLAELARRAGLAKAPELYVIPSMTLNAFATGKVEQAVIGVTEGLLRRLSLRELTAVLAHEISHIRNNDLSVMGLADAMTRFTQSLSYLALFLAIFNLPGLLTGDSTISLSALLLLYLAPTFGSLIQLALSRTREYDADFEGVGLTGDPEGMASALERLERYQGRFWEDLMLPVPGRRIPQPSLLRTHPSTEERVARLRALAGRQSQPPIETVEEPMITLVGVGPATLRPRYRFPGVWF